MGYKSERLWQILEEKVDEEDSRLVEEQKLKTKYLSGIEKICDFAIQRAITIRDNFPMYTLHDERHICNVMRLMLDLLGNEEKKLTRDETAMLILAACCHDIGMSYSEQEKNSLFGDLDRFNKYLDTRHSEYVKAYAENPETPIMTDEIAQNYLRSIHHERVAELLRLQQWPEVLEGKVERENLIAVCQSHCKDISSLDLLNKTNTIDLRFCAILLRLADIMDFDTSRAPQAVYDYSGFSYKEDGAAMVSKEEWNKHMASHGFDFRNVNREYSYELNYHATCKSMQIEQAINCYIDWVDQELDNCGKLIKRYSGNWTNFTLPNKIKRNIISEGYVSGQFCLTLDQERIIELLVGKDLYSNPAIFVRELIQNAIDAVRTREKLDKELPSKWKPQINIRSWIDEKGYHWFRIEDNGIGMTENVIMNYFLKVGRSYYSSDEFKQEKLRCRAKNYTPISRFGIGILSCFMGDESATQVEISTKRFNESRNYYPALRLSMHGMNGFYYLADKNKGHLPGPMKGVTEEEQEPYRNSAGTTIAVRTNLYLAGNFKGFKEIVDKYVVYPVVDIHYDGPEGSFDYPTESQFMQSIKSIQPSDDISKRGLFEFVLAQKQLDEMSQRIPELTFKTPPKLLLKCAALSDYTNSQNLSGAILTAAVTGLHEPIKIKFDNQIEEAKVEIEVFTNEVKNELGIRVEISFSDEFRSKMKYLREHQHNIPFYCNKLYNDFSKNNLLMELVRGVENNYFAEKSWYHYIKQRYNITDNELKKNIDFVSAKLKSISGKSLDELINEFKIVQKFNQFDNQFDFIVCKLSDFEWYNKYFINTMHSSGARGVVAHNGVLCGDSSIFINYNKYSKNFLNLIILLKDGYRPVVDVARDGIRSVPLEVACDFENIKQRISFQGFNLNENYEFHDHKYHLIPVIEYWNLLETRSDMQSNLLLSTENKYYYSNELLDVIKSKKYLILDHLRAFSKSWTYDEYLYDTLCKAYLQKNYSLRLQLTKYNSMHIQIAEKTQEDDTFNSKVKDLPAAFFIQPLNSEDKYLTSNSAYTRYAYNANHPLSKFIINNCEILMKNVPGIFQEIIRVLCDEQGENLIKNMNNLLSQLRNIPGDIIHVPVDLCLTKQDLI